ncbi:MAG: VWA-like domain-containing protein [Gammaproteobacteria bacterium]|nr:VWA-like domain-containing protein [Gammaproteobacteria bacterium]MCW8986877.1 VWA-like domain-containing protein [Gammaproteobacteria bacterium]
MINQAEHDLNPVELKLTAARTRLIIDKPFLGALVLRLPMEQADPEWCKTTATDARKFYYNYEFIDCLSIEETQFMLSHEALHCALSHFSRRQHRVTHKWDLSCDYAINPLLIKDGLTPPPGTLHLREYEGMTAEEIYPLIDDLDNQETLDQHIYDDSNSEGENNLAPPPESDSDADNTTKEKSPSQGAGSQQSPEQQTGQSGSQPSSNDKEGGGQSSQPQKQDKNQNGKGAEKPQPLTHQEKENLTVQWQQRLAGAAQQAMQAGKLDGEMARMVDFLLQPQLPWRNLVSRYLNSIARDDYSYTRPSTRRGDPAIYPSLRSAQLDIAIAIDTSGSISQNEIQEFVSEIDSLKGQMRARVTLIACDSELAEGCPWIYEPWEEFSLPKSIKGGGGTRFTPVFDWANKQDKMPDILVYFTDADGEFPNVEPAFDVLWLIKGKSKVPWGQRVQLN